ncbi:putative O-glycosylation ligase, exosortase A system-associated [Thiohalorhabdus denitrificans]|uniref:Probable O-glycosylation ligase, exosortase A-associated n=1 Tax=Thiohalorhabdus denitrificans TaxID=381306 RepID=A0A1G5DCV6_9GAMM|nr:putative O-glycosylation ligase, exosortase A system-associated [Thiohalorhabdus denitrificans]SCY12659.1 probable O-glycosylation ligase, exosortase A-associated [Thiohalorhabdus denitrificans]
MRDAALLVIFASLIPFVLVRPWTGVLVWSWVGFMNPHRLGWGVAQDLPVALVFGSLTLVAMWLHSDRKPIPLTRETVLIILLMIVFTITTFTAWVPEAAWPQWEKVMKILAFALVTTMLIYGRKRILALLVVVAGSLAFYGVKGAAFVASTGGQYRVKGPEPSFIGANTALGLALLMVLPLLVALAREVDSTWGRRAIYGVVVLTVIATLFTYSRGALLGLAVVLPIMLIKANRKFLLFLLLIPAAYKAPDFIPERLMERAESIEQYEEDRSAMQRIQAWQVGWNVALERPWLGAGFKLEEAPNALWLDYAEWQDEHFNRSRAAHSNYFQMLGEHGFLGTALYLLLLFFTFGSLRRIKKQAPGVGLGWMVKYADALQTGLIAYAVAGAFLSLAYFDLFYTFVILAAIMRREIAEATEKVAAHASDVRGPLSRAPARAATPVPAQMPRGV